MTGQTSRAMRALLWAWAVAIAVFLYLPSICGAIASFGASRYFLFPVPNWGLELVRKDLQFARDPPAAADLD